LRRINSGYPCSVIAERHLCEVAAIERDDAAAQKTAERDTAVAS